MGFPLGPRLASVFMCHFEKIWLENCLTQFKPVVYERFRSTEHVEKIKKYLKKQHKNIVFTSEIEQSGSLSFLDIKISGETTDFSPQFKETLHLVEFLPILKVLFPNLTNVV